MIDAIAGRLLVRDYAAKSGSYTPGNATTAGTWTLPAINLSAFRLKIEAKARFSEVGAKEFQIELNGNLIRNVDLTGQSLFQESFILDYQDSGYLPEFGGAAIPLGLSASYLYPSVAPARVAWNVANTSTLVINIYDDPAGASGDFRLDFLRVTAF